MRKKYTIDEQEQLSKLPMIQKVTLSTITFTPDFIKFVVESKFNSTQLRNYLDNNGFPVQNYNSGKYFAQLVERFNQRYSKLGEQIAVEQRGKARKYLPKEVDIQSLSPEEQIKYLEKELREKEIEIMLLKKYGTSTKVENTPIKIKVSAILNALVGDKKYSISELCKVLKLGRSTFYSHIRHLQYLNQKRHSERNAISAIRRFFNRKNRKVGYRQIKMYIDGFLKYPVNHKRIIRIMRENNLVCRVRKRNPYKHIIGATQEHVYHKNILNREFKSGHPYTKLLTDITYIYYGKGQKAYLSAIKDSVTGEIISYTTRGDMKLNLSLDVVEQAKNKFIKGTTIIHSDQGVHYSASDYCYLLKNVGVRQSMSRRGNCIDNAPMESFFGHLKDEISFEKCNTLTEVQEEIRKYMLYYNQRRKQWTKKKMTPIQYRNHLLSI